MGSPSTPLKVRSYTAQKVVKLERKFTRVARSPEHLVNEVNRRGWNWRCTPENPLGLLPAGAHFRICRHFDATGFAAAPLVEYRRQNTRQRVATA